ncbi:hypothetical protein ST37_10835 [Vibrio sp. qd031]|uniref:hypothetical protein n=1 Tax=Vibrio sp. qd031 TaxID=1603038 RepID=UPI000A11122D|nr:hypothetical protein [Vibrio sp. qd031]ORT50359.1 hypothetical protein ST37_10835 [Vibrio sp. qd031]
MGGAYMMFKRKLKGAPASKYKELQRIKAIETFIDKRFGIEVDHWREKHFVYVIRVCCKDLAPTTREDYRRTLYKLLELMDKKQWKVKLNKIYNNSYRKNTRLSGY